MPDIRIHRDHSLGLAKARKVAWDWAEQVRTEVRHGMHRGRRRDQRHGGVHAQRRQRPLIVAADHFDLDAKLGFLLGAFSKTIEAEIRRTSTTCWVRRLLAAQKPKRSAARSDRMSPSSRGALPGRWRALQAAWASWAPRRKQGPLDRLVRARPP
jgi:hypothetical protein